MTSAAKTEGARRTEGRGLALFLEAAWYAFGFAAVLALGLVNLAYPFGLDQAAYFYGAEAIDRGATLYVDYWDNKQPGLYAFYLLAGRLFGFSETGIHLLELIWMLTFAAVLMVTLRPYLQAPWLSALAPAATIGVYYATVGEHELTQLEMMVGFPLYLTAWTALQAIRSAVKEERAPAFRLAALFFLGGLCAGTATLFKLLLAPIAMAFWLVASAYLVMGRRVSLAGLLGVLWVPAGLGAMLPVTAIVLWFWQASALQELLWTAFAYPPQALESSPPASVTRIATAAVFIATNTAPWLLFAVAAVVIWLKRWHRRECGPLIAIMLVWLLLAGAFFLVQRFSWWHHHMLLMLTPFGVLAIYGIDGLAGYFTRFVTFAGNGEAGGRSHRALPAMACAALVAFAPLASLTNPLLTKAMPLLAGGRVLVNGAQMYHWEVSENYKRLWQGSLFLTYPSSRAGPIYVFGNAIVYHFTGRRSAHETTGSAWRFYLPSQIRDIMDTIESREVPYVFVDANDIKIFRLRPQITDYLRKKYKVVKKDDSGIWYERL